MGVGFLVGFLPVHFTALTLPLCCRSVLSGGSVSGMPACPQVEITAAAPSSVGFHLPSLWVQNLDVLFIGAL